MMFWSAMEVFPKECMGCLCEHQGRIVLAIPYQTAKRKEEEVESISSSFFETTLDSQFKKICDYHSHTRVGKREKPGLSETDTKDLAMGEMEAIVHIRRCRSNKHGIRQNPGGTVSVAWGCFRGLIAAFVRRKDPNGVKKTYYESMGLVLES